MSSSKDKTIRVISFSGKKQSWRQWSRKFLAMAAKRGYRDVLQGKLKEKTMDEDEKSKNAHAYNDLILSMTEEVSFAIVDESVTEACPEGDSSLAWKRLELKYESQTSTTKVQLMRMFSASRLKSSKKDPDVWISDLESIRARLKKMDYQVEDKYMIIHVLNNLPKEYDNLVDNLEERIDAQENPLTVDNLREKLQSKYEKIRLKMKEEGSDFEDDSDEDEKRNNKIEKMDSEIEILLQQARKGRLEIENEHERKLRALTTWLDSAAEEFVNLLLHDDEDDSDL